MGSEDNGPNSDELARRIEALERENRELREALGSGPSRSDSQRTRQRPQAIDVTGASTKTVRGLLLGPRDEQAYSRPLAGVLPSYVVGCLLTFAAGAYGAYIAFLATVGLTALAPVGWGSPREPR
jgi:hypothetical protein